MSSFEREKSLVEGLLRRLGLDASRLTDPNASMETGIDVVVHLNDQRVIGVQVTEVDPYPAPKRR